MLTARQNELLTGVEHDAPMSLLMRDLNHYALLSGSKADVWRQEREAIGRGHFSGFDKCILDEDMVVQASMGAITDRTKEQLCGSDLGVVRTRERLLRALEASDESDREGDLLDLIAAADVDWRELAGTNDQPLPAPPSPAQAFA